MLDKNMRLARMLNSICGRKEIVIMDLDGTMADLTHRLPLLPTENLDLTQSWREFNAAAIDDDPIQDNIGVCNALSINKIVVVLSGRSGEYEKEARLWLDIHGVNYHYIAMRDQEDNRKDTVIKEEFLRAVGLDRILCAFDDSPGVIRHLRAMGITTYAVVDNEGSDRSDLKSHGVYVNMIDTAAQKVTPELKASCAPGGKIYNMAIGKF